ncbi:MAG: hypothetical protein R2705_13980 [Ilumatobacteraceae bacterium]
MLVVDTVEYPVQVNGKVRLDHRSGRRRRPAVEAIALADDKVAGFLERRPEEGHRGSGPHGQHRGVTSRKPRPGLARRADRSAAVAGASALTASRNTRAR